MYALYKMTWDTMLSLCIISFRNQSCMLNSCGNIISFLINRAFFPLLKTQHWKKKKKNLPYSAYCWMCFLGFGELVSLPRENSREPSSVPGSGCWLSFSSVSTAALLPPTPIPSCKLIRLFLLLAVKKESNWKSVVSMLKYLGTVDILWDGRAIRVQRYKRIIKSMWEWFLQFACSEAESTPLFLHLLEAPWIVFGVS